MIKLKVVNRKSPQTMTRRLHSELCFKFEASTKHHFNADHRPITDMQTAQHRCSWTWRRFRTLTVTLLDGHISAGLLVGESALNKGQCMTAARQRERRLGAEFQEVRTRRNLPRSLLLSDVMWLLRLLINWIIYRTEEPHIDSFLDSYAHSDTFTITLLFLPSLTCSLTLIHACCWLAVSLACK